MIRDVKISLILNLKQHRFTQGTMIPRHSVRTSILGYEHLWVWTIPHVWFSAQSGFVLVMRAEMIVYKFPPNAWSLYQDVITSVLMYLLAYIIHDISYINIAYICSCSSMPCKRGQYRARANGRQVHAARKLLLLSTPVKPAEGKQTCQMCGWGEFVMKTDWSAESHVFTIVMIETDNLITCSL